MRITTETYEEKLDRKRDDPSSLSLPEFLTLLEDKGNNTTKERLEVYKIIPLEERTEVLVLVKEPIHLRVIWVAEKLPRSYSQPSH